MIPRNSSYTLEDTAFLGRVEDFTWNEEVLELTILTHHERLSGKLEDVKEGDVPTFEWNDLVLVHGSLKELSSNTTPYLFNYQEYARRHQQFYSIQIQSIDLVQKNSNPFYKVKGFLKKRVAGFKSAPYLEAFLFGDTSYIDEDIMESYRDNGVSHLLAISGMHVSFLMGVLAFFLEKSKMREEFQFIFYLAFLSFYIFLVGFSPSVLRASLFFLLLRVKRLLSWDIKPIYLLVFLFFFLLFINPYYLWEVGFQYSFAISFPLVLSSVSLNEGHYFKKLFATSYLAFLPSILIGVYHFHQIQLFSVFYNLFFVPVVSFLIFPLSFLTFLFPFLEPIYLFLIGMMEQVSLFLTQFRGFFWIMRHPSILGIIYLSSCILLVYYLFRKKRRWHILVLLVSLYVYHCSCYFLPEDYMISLDVGQGDATFLFSRGGSVLVDTGGSIYKDYATRVIIPYLKAKGVLKIDTLVLTHGDYDHMGAATNLVENFKVEKVIFNCGPYNDLENQFIQMLEKKKIEHYSCIKKLNIHNNKLYFLNTREYDNENDYSNVIYTELNHYKFLLMGDASIFTEKEILDKYNLPHIDVLKVGHHGSKTSSSKEFINTINPKYSIISVGKNNRYGHPNKEVLEILNNSKIYRTDMNGSIIFKIKKDTLEIETCPS